MPVPRGRCKDRLFQKSRKPLLVVTRVPGLPSSEIGFKIGEKMRVFPWQNNVYRRSDFCRQGEDSLSRNISLGLRLKTPRIGADVRERAIVEFSSSGGQGSVSSVFTAPIRIVPAP